jgi:hypothetical protein
VANAVSDSLAILIGNGDGSFQRYVEYPGGFDPNAVVAGDFNGDGRVDVAMADTSLAGPQVSIFLGNGDGTMQPRIDYPIAGAAVSLLVGDFNGDGLLDLAAGTTPKGGPSQVPAGGTLSVLLGKGDGSFQPHRDFGGVSYSYSLIAADLNGDGQLDIALVNPDEGAVNVLLGDGRGSFGSVMDTVAALGPTQLLAGDFNGDGKQDIAYASQGSGTISVSLGNGDGTFQAPLNNQAPGGGSTLVASYLNADKKLDVAAVIGSEISPVVLLGNGDGTFGPRMGYPVQFPTGALSVGDFNGDKVPDLLVPGSSLNVLLGNGDGSFRSAIESTGTSGPGVVADFNHDNKQDYAGLQGNAVGIFLGNGDGSFQPEVDYPTGTKFTAPVAITADYLDGDGNIDLAVANAATNDVSVFLGNSDGTFQPPAHFPVIRGPRAITSGDLNADGNTDLIVSGDGGVSVLLGNGDGTFKPQVSYAKRGESIVAAEFNADSKLDFATASSYNYNTFSVFLNAPSIALFPSKLAFNPQLVGTRSTPLTILVSNPGTVALAITDVVISGDLAQTNTCPVFPTTLAPGTNCTISVTFTPTMLGDRTGKISLSDDALAGQQFIELTGIGASRGLAFVRLHLART